MRNNSTRKKGKKNSTSQFWSFEHNGTKICDQQKKPGKPWREKCGAHADMVPEGFGNFIAKDELRQWLRFAWKNVLSDTLWELIHSIPHHL